MYLATPVVAVSARMEDTPKAKVAMPHTNQNGDGRRHVLVRAGHLMLSNCRERFQYHGYELIAERMHAPVKYCQMTVVMHADSGRLPRVTVSPENEIDNIAYSMYAEITRWKEKNVK